MYLKTKIFLFLYVTFTIIFSFLISCNTTSYVKSCPKQYKIIFPTFIYSVASIHDIRYSEEIILKSAHLTDTNSKAIFKEPFVIQPKQSWEKDGYDKSLYSLFKGNAFNKSGTWFLLNISPVDNQKEDCIYIKT